MMEREDWAGAVLFLTGAVVALASPAYRLAGVVAMAATVALWAVRRFKGTRSARRMRLRVLAHPGGPLKYRRASW